MHTHMHAHTPLAPCAHSGQVRSGKEYYEGWEKYAATGGDSDDEVEEVVPLSKRAPKVPDTKPAADDAASAAATRSGPALTQSIIAANAGLTEAERMYNAEQEKAKGNECFRAKEYAAAVERYTISLALNPTNGSVRGNRAAAYLKLRLWAEAAADCDAALEADPNFVKARVRRATARLELGENAGAMDDIDAALAVDPDNREVAAMKTKADKMLNQATTRRVVIEEEDDDDEADVVASDKPPSRAAARTRIAVVDDSDSDEGGEPASKTSPKSPLGGVLPKGAAAAAKGKGAPPPAPASRMRIPVEEDSDGDDSSDDTAAPPAKAAWPADSAKPAKAAAQPAKAAKPAPAFVASARFTGARAGYLFTRRGEGVGYYREGGATPAEEKAAAAAVAAAAAASAAAVAAKAVAAAAAAAAPAPPAAAAAAKAPAMPAAPYVPRPSLEEQADTLKVRIMTTARLFSRFDASDGV
jgi:hypothetical protein